MALKLLFDEHISPRVAEQVRRHSDGIWIESIHQWRNGAYTQRAHRDILIAAQQHGLTLVTFDVNTILETAGQLSMQGLRHSGIVFVPQRRIANDDLGGLVRGLLEAYRLYGEDDWTDRISFLER